MAESTRFDYGEAVQIAVASVTLIQKSIGGKLKSAEFWRIGRGHSIEKELTVVEIMITKKLTPDTVRRRVIGGKRVYIFERHNFALCAWAEIKRSHSPELALITLDYHTDTQPAFKRFANDGNRSKMESRIAERLSQIDVRDNQSVFEAAVDLANDEQIDAAMRLKLFNAAFCFNQQNKTTPSIAGNHNTKPDWLSLIDWDSPEDLVVSDRIFEVGEAYAIGWTGSVRDGAWDRPFADQAIESVMLKQLISRANSLAGSMDIPDLREQAFVLDIDLDYFRTMDSLAPKDPSAFHELIRRAKAITIATEPSFVKTLGLEDKLTADFALARVTEHIDSALATCKPI